MIIIISGIVWMGLGNLDNFHNSMSNSDFSPSRLSLAFYSGLFSYAGWNYLNFVTEELKDPNKNLPRAIYVSMPLVTCTYLLANVAYFAVLNTSEILASNAVAVVRSSFWSSFSLSLNKTFNLDLRKPIAWCHVVDHAIFRRMFNIWSRQWWHFCIFSFIFRWSPKWSYAKSHGTHQHLQTHSNALFGISGKDIYYHFYFTLLMFYLAIKIK